MKKRTIIMDIECQAPESVFESDWKNVPEQWQKIVEDHNGISCEGTGIISPFCVLPKECPFAEWDGGWESE